MSLSADDRLEILELASRYSRCIDRGDPDGLAQLFTEDGVWESSARGVRRGREAIREEFAARAAQAHTRKHWFSNPIIEAAEGDVDRATMTLDLLVLHLDDGDLHLGTSGTYEDTLVRTTEGWRIAHRRIEVDGQVREFRRRRESD